MRRTPAFSAYVSEVELERLNLVRTSDAVLWRKLVEVETRLELASKVTLDGAGPITTWRDDVASTIDASPDQAAIYAAAAADPPVTTLEEGPPAEGGQAGGLMDTGSIPGLPLPASDPDDDPATGWISQGGQGFDNWMLAAAAIGTAAGKYVPITIDAVEYDNRVSSPDGTVVAWGCAPVLPETAMVSSSSTSGRSRTSAPRCIRAGRRGSTFPR